MQAKLTNQEACASIDNAKSVVRLLILIRDLQYNMSKRKRLILATVEAGFDLYSCAQGGKTTDNY